LRTISEQRLNWRRDKVRELSVKGCSQRKIADTLKISLTLVNEDLQYLRLKAKENISKYIVEYLPAEYENCLDGLNDILQEAWTMSTDADSDKRERMQALALAKECYAMKLELLSSATVVDRAVKFVERNRGSLTEDRQQNGKVRIDHTAYTTAANNTNDTAEPKQAAG
jgi:predicted transcriptional regulator